MRISKASGLKRLASTALSASFSVSLLFTAPVEGCEITVLETRMANPVLKSIFGGPLLEGFSASDFGVAWEDGEAGRANLLAPADITSVEEDAQRVGTLALWPGMESLPGVTSSVNEFYSESRKSLDTFGRAIFSDYDPENPQSREKLTVRESLVGTQSEASALKSYDDAYRRVYYLKKAVSASGYPDAEWNGDSIKLGSFEESAADWDDFVSAYSRLTEANRSVSALHPPSLDLIHKVMAPPGSSGIAPSLQTSGICYK